MVKFKEEIIEGLKDEAEKISVKVEPPPQH